MAVWNHLKIKRVLESSDILKKMAWWKLPTPKEYGAITPVVNPVMTPMHNAMIALKGANAIIIAPHPAGKYVEPRPVK